MKCNIAITHENRDAIEAALDKAQYEEAGASVRCIDNDAVFDAAAGLDIKLAGIRMSDLNGTVVRCCEWSEYPGITTNFDLRHNGKTWRLVEIVREPSRKNVYTFLDAPRALCVGIVTRELGVARYDVQLAE